MQNKYSLWRNVSIIIVIIFSVIYALPNIFGDEPILQISPLVRGELISAELINSLEETLKKDNIAYKSISKDTEQITIHFFDTENQLKANDVIKKIDTIKDKFTSALNLMSKTPNWLHKLGASPMKLGLDLRGGVHFLLDVDMNSIVKRREESLVKSIRQELRNAKIRYKSVEQNTQDKLTEIKFEDDGVLNKAQYVLQRSIPDVGFKKDKINDSQILSVFYSPQSYTEARQNTIEQTMSTLRNRVNELGVAEAVVQQQGSGRIAVDLPGIQDATRAKEIIGGTATLEFHLVDEKNSSQAGSNAVPFGSKSYEHLGRPILLYNQVLLSGGSITSAMSFSDETGRPAVKIRLGGGGETLFHRITGESIGKLMAIVFVETKTVTMNINGEIVKTRKKVEKIISVAMIQSALGNNFQITGLRDMQEARNLALFLRAGALPAAIEIVEESTVGPTLGIENIKKGILSLEIGMGLVMIFMLLYYRMFGFIANVALMINLVILVALLSLIGATLTLPGIAGIVLTIGIAVDANILINERIREELRNGNSIQSSIYTGYERAFETIVDANLTALIVGIVLFAIGKGAIQGFAITFIVGLLTSMFTGVACTRALVNAIYGNRKVDKLSIGGVY